MADITDFGDLRVWQVAHEIRLEIYLLIRKLPESERYNLASQLRRAATSIAANIAEGFGRFHYQENIQFCRQARGSLEEVRDGIMLARDAKLLESGECEAILRKLVECRQILNGYIRSLNTLKSHAA